MPLESLLKLAETLSARAAEHADALSASETLTRYALIDPLLRALGWDTSDPSAVMPEYETRRGVIADYALLKAGKPAAIMEAKKLGASLWDNSIRRIPDYCIAEGVAHFAITNGARWEIYTTRDYVSIGQNPATDFNLLADSPAEFCLKALALWRPNIAAPTSPCPNGWRSFTNTGYKVGRKPLELQFPDESRTDVGGWFSLLLETVRWLSSSGHLTKERCPIRDKKSRRVIVDAKPFLNSIEVNGFYVHKHNLVKVHFCRAKTVIKCVGQDPSQFCVRFRE